jgi:hypothetical protein
MTAARPVNIPATNNVVAKQESFHPSNFSALMGRLLCLRIATAGNYYGSELPDLDLTSPTSPALIDTVNCYVRPEVGRVGCLARVRLHKADIGRAHAAIANSSRVPMSIFALTAVSGRTWAKLSVTPLSVTVMSCTSLIPVRLTVMVLPEMTGLPEMLPEPAVPRLALPLVTELLNMNTSE